MAGVVDFSAGLDGLQEDMAAHQRRIGKEPTAESNRLLAAEEAQKWDRQASESKQVDHATEQQAGGETKKPPALDVAPDDMRQVRVDDRTQRLVRTIGARVELLMSKRESGALGQPSWRDRVLAVMYWRAKSAGYWKAGRTAEADDLERRYMHELKQLLDESNATFGDWRKERSPLLMVG